MTSHKKTYDYEVYDDKTKKWIKFDGTKIAYEGERWSHGTSKIYEAYLTNDNKYVIYVEYRTNWLDCHGKPQNNLHYAKVCNDKAEVLDYLTFELAVSSDPRVENLFRGKTTNRYISDLLDKLEISHEYE